MMICSRVSSYYSSSTTIILLSLPSFGFVYGQGLGHSRHHLCQDNDATTFGVSIAATSNAVLLQNEGEKTTGRVSFIVGNTQDGIRRSLLYFDTKTFQNTFPGDGRIECAEIMLYVTGDTPLQNQQKAKFTLHQVTTDWPTERGPSLSNYDGTQIFNAQQGDVTWTHSNYPSFKWDNAGADFNQDPISREVILDEHHYFGSSPAINSLLNAWVKGEEPNYGFLLKGDETHNDDTSYEIFHGVENDAIFVPHLLIRYTSPSRGKDYLTHQHFRYPHLHGGFGVSSQTQRDIIVFSVVTIVGVMVVVGMAFFVRRQRTGKERTATMAVELTGKLDTVGRSTAGEVIGTETLTAGDEGPRQIEDDKEII